MKNMLPVMARWHHGQNKKTILTKFRHVEFRHAILDLISIIKNFVSLLPDSINSRYDRTSISILSISKSFEKYMIFYLQAYFKFLNPKLKFRSSDSSGPDSVWQDLRFVFINVRESCILNIWDIRTRVIVKKQPERGFQYLFYLWKKKN